MRHRNIAIFSAAALAGIIAGSAVGPRPAAAGARLLNELQRDVSTLLQGQKDLQSQMTQDHTVMKTLVEQSSDNVGRLNSTMSSLQKSVQDVQANSGAPLHTMSTQVQGLSDNLEEIKSRMGKLNQQLVDLQNTMQSVDAKISGGGGGQPPASTQPNQGSASNNGFPTTPAYSSNGSVSPRATNPAASSGPPPSGAPTADTLYSNGLRDITSGKYDLARSEFQDYIRYYADTDLASNAQFYLGEIAYSQKQFDQAVAEYDKVLTNYPKSFKLAPARFKKGMALIDLGQKTAGVRELREVVKRYPSTEEDRRARAKLKELGVAITATR